MPVCDEAIIHVLPNATVNEYQAGGRDGRPYMQLLTPALVGATVPDRPRINNHSNPDAYLLCQRIQLPQAFLQGAVLLFDLPGQPGFIFLHFYAQVRVPDRNNLYRQQRRVFRRV